jgi:hypothetical protein
MRETTVQASELAPGDVILETGLAGILGRITAVRVFPFPRGVDVTVEGREHHYLPRFEVCRVEREGDVVADIDAQLAAVFAEGT